MLKSILILLLGTAQAARAADAQVVFSPESETSQPSKLEHAVDNAILAALEVHSDPVAALISLDPENELLLAEPCLLRVLDDDSEPQWMTEGDKLRLRRQGKKFMDITDHEEFYAEQIHILTAGKPREFLPCVSLAHYVRLTYAQTSLSWFMEALSGLCSLRLISRVWLMFSTI